MNNTQPRHIFAQLFDGVKPMTAASADVVTLTDPSAPPRREQLEALAARAVAHVGCRGAYFSSWQRCAIAAEAQACLGACEACASLEEACFRDATGFAKALASAHAGGDCPLEPDLRAAVHAIANFQARMSRDYYHDAVVPAAAAAAGVAELAEDDREGAAMELLAVAALACSLTVMELGLGKGLGEGLGDGGGLSTFDPADATAGAPEPRLRVTALVSATRHRASLGWGPYLSPADFSPGEGSLAKQSLDGFLSRFCTGAMSPLSPMFPAKSLAAGNLADLAFTLEWMAGAYVPLACFTNLRGSHRRGLRRAQMETVAHAYAGARKCLY